VKDVDEAEVGDDTELFYRTTDSLVPKAFITNIIFPLSNMLVNLCFDSFSLPAMFGWF